MYNVQVCFWIIQIIDSSIDLGSSNSSKTATITCSIERTATSCNTCTEKNGTTNKGNKNASEINKAIIHAKKIAKDERKKIYKEETDKETCDPEI